MSVLICGINALKAVDSRRHGSICHMALALSVDMISVTRLLKSILPFLLQVLNGSDINSVLRMNSRNRLQVIQVVSI